jgi:hypothetical protein
MSKPKGALNREEWRILKYAFPDKIIYRVSGRRRALLGMFHAKRAITWYFSGTPPIYYFDNYWLAYAYAVKRGLRGDDLQVKIRY